MIDRNRTYAEFLSTKTQRATDFGFEPSFLPDSLFDFQKLLVEWAVRKGRAAIFADCGLGKTLMQLVWAENVVRKTGRPVLIITPLAVSQQTVKEAAKFGIECERVVDGKHTASIAVTNYERIGHCDTSRYGGVVADESSILKNYGGKTKAIVTDFMRTHRYRLLCTATAAPNDFHELGTSSEALGYLGYQDMLSRFFKEDIVKDFLGWGRKQYRFRGHAQRPFWQWVASWARACRRPSDLGCDDGKFQLPPLSERECVLDVSRPLEGMLFAMPARTLPEQRAERRATLAQRCDRIAEIVGQDTSPSVTWCHLNDEANYLEKAIEGSQQVSGSMSNEAKEERLLAFQAGEIQHLVTKPKIGCFGLNWQHCHRVMMFPSHSWEQYYQAVRRCWRFGQTNEVSVDIVTTEGELAALKNLQRKAGQADQMFTELTASMRSELQIDRSIEATITEEVPGWLS